MYLFIVILVCSRKIFYQNAGILESGDNPPTSYTITYSDALSGSICGSATVPAYSCMNGTCCHTFGEISSPCSSNGDISVAVFAMSIVGDGPSSQPLIFSLKTPEHGRGKFCIRMVLINDNFFYPMK